MGARGTVAGTGGGRPAARDDVFFDGTEPGGPTPREPRSELPALPRFGPNHGSAGHADAQRLYGHGREDDCRARNFSDRRPKPVYAALGRLVRDGRHGNAAAYGKRGGQGREKPGAACRGCKPASELARWSV